MLDMGFNEDIMKIAKKLPAKRQNLMFSATMPPKIRALTASLLKDPITISIAISKPNAAITQGAFMVHDGQKIELIKSLLKDKEYEHIIIFASRKTAVKEITQALKRVGLPAKGIQSDLDQKQREEILLDFKNKKVKILVATDILSRGIDIKGINMVINYEVPHDAEDYVHRIGRTARGEDTSGEAYTFINGEQCIITEFCQFVFNSMYFLRNIDCFQSRDV